MENQTEYAGRMLDEARQLFGAGDHQRSLELYEWFFDHALDEDPASFYGVRLSYCLSEWAELGQKYQPARIRLEQKFSDSILEFERLRNPERFHDYVTIGEYIGQPAAGIEKFLEYHHANFDLAKEIVHFVWDALVNSEHCNVCGAYVQDVTNAYELLLEKFDSEMEICKANPELGVEEFATQIKAWHKRGVENLIKALIASRRIDDAKSICLVANDDIVLREVHDISIEFPS